MRTILAALLALPAVLDAAESTTRGRPSILWLTAEDICPNLGCYGDSYALSPSVDRFSTQSMPYTQAFGITAVCAPNRSCLITGVSPSKLKQGRSRRPR